MATASESKLIRGATGDWEVVVGMEIHAQVSSRSKLFSGAATGFGAEPNSQVSFVDAAMPGMLPVINGFCVAQAVRTGLGLKARINRRSVFDRKNYFYPDLPQGYQISQYKHPIVGEGEVQVDVTPERQITVGIERLHLGTRCEIKNVNSIRFIGQAVEAEARRQIGVIEDGGAIEQETRLFDPGRGETRAMRSKEEAHDYRYFPDPDLLPLELDDAYIEALAADLPELPDAKKARFVADYGLSAYDAGVLVAERDLADYYERAVAAEPRGAGPRDAKLVANWVTGDIAAFANASGLPVHATHLAPEQVAGLVDLIADGTISGKIAKDVLALMVGGERDASPRDIVERHGMRQVTDAGAIEAAVDAIIAANPDKVAQAIAKPTMLGWFVGQTMKATGGKANPQTVNAVLRGKLGL